MVPVLSPVIVHFSQHSHKSSRGSHALVTRSPTVAGSNADRAVARFTAWLAGAETVREWGCVSNFASGTKEFGLRKGWFPFSQNWAWPVGMPPCGGHGEPAVSSDISA